MRQSLARMSRFAEASGFKLTVVLMPWADRLTHGSPYQTHARRVGKIARDAGFDVIDLYPEWIEAAEKGLDHFLENDQCHPNPDGARATARRIARHYRQENP